MYECRKLLQMKSKYVIKHDKFLKKCKNMKNFQNNMGNHENIRKFIKKSKNRKVNENQKN